MEGHSITRGDFNNQIMIEEVDGEPRVTVFLRDSASKLMAGVGMAVSAVMMM